MPKKTRRRRSHRRYELSVTKIRELEKQTFLQFQNVVRPVEPRIIFRDHYTNNRCIYGLGGLEAKGFINQFHVLNATVYAGKQDGEKINYIKLSPISSDDFDDNYNEAMKRYQNGEKIDFSRMEQYQKTNELVAAYSIMFQNDFETPKSSKHTVDFYRQLSYEHRSYQFYKKQGFDFLKAEPLRQQYSACLDFTGKDTKKTTRDFQTSLFLFANKTDLIEPLYEELLFKHDAVNNFAL